MNRSMPSGSAMVLRAPALEALTTVRHGFCTRQGGVSTGAFTSLNCGLSTGDAADNVALNRARAVAAIDDGARMLLTAYQTHGNGVAIVESPWEEDARPPADAMVTKVPGLALGVLTADCAPVLLADPGAGVIGAVHAGWKGILAGIVETAIDTMMRLGADPGRIVAAIGPCIAQASYEVGPEFPDRFMASDATADEFFAPAPRAGHYQFDCRGCVRQRLHAAGVPAVEVLPHDTCADEEQFFSYRRARLNDEASFGLELSAISLAG